MVFGLLLLSSSVISDNVLLHPKQYLPYSIRQEIKKLDSFSEQIRFMVDNKIETREDLEIFAKKTIKNIKISWAKEKIFEKDITEPKRKIKNQKY